MTSDREHEGWRPEVRAFADLMEAQLRANDHKPGWKDELPLNDLFPRLIEEAEELRGELKHGTRGGFAEWSCSVGREAADVANFAMMIADVCGALSRSPVLGGGGETQQDQEVMASVAQSAAAGPSGCAASETACQSEVSPLDRAWRAIDALGGTYPETDAWERGYASGHAKALNDACAEIEKLGGRPS